MKPVDWSVALPRYSDARASATVQAVLTLFAILLFSVACLIDALVQLQVGSKRIIALRAERLLDALAGWSEWVLGAGAWWFPAVMALVFLGLQLLSTETLHTAATDPRRQRNRIVWIMRLAASATTAAWLLAVTSVVAQRLALNSAPTGSAASLVFTGLATAVIFLGGVEVGFHHSNDVLWTRGQAFDNAVDEDERRCEDLVNVPRSHLRLRLMSALGVALVVSAACACTFGAWIMALGYGVGTLPAAMVLAVSVTLFSSCGIVVSASAQAASKVPLLLYGWLGVLFGGLLIGALLGAVATVAYRPPGDPKGSLPWVAPVTTLAVVAAIVITVARKYSMAKRHRFQSRWSGWMPSGVVLLREARNAGTRLERAGRWLAHALEEHEHRLSALAPPHKGRTQIIESHRLPSHGSRGRTQGE